MNALAVLSLCTVLSACVSSESPTALQINSQTEQNDLRSNNETTQLSENSSLDSGEQVLAKSENGNVIAIPQLSPKKLASASLAKEADQNKVVAINNSTAEITETKPANQQLASAQVQNKPETKTRSPGLLSLLFQKPANNQTTSSQQQKQTAPVNEAVQAADYQPQTNSANNTEKVEQAVEENSQVASEVKSEANSNVASFSSQQTQPNVQKRSPGLFALLKQRNAKTKKAEHPKDDRMNTILLSSRTASRANRYSAPPRNRNLELLPGKKKENGTQVASAAALLRNPFNGIATQHSGVDVDCITPGVIRILNIVEKKYGSKPVVTSGYRSPSRNRRAGGARNSMHIYCRAVDIQVKGISKWELAKFLRTIPGRGGVGTYCRTKSVHIDTGPKRDWHYPCRRKSKRKRRA